MALGCCSGCLCGEKLKLLHPIVKSSSIIQKSSMPERLVTPILSPISPCAVRLRVALQSIIRLPPNKLLHAEEREMLWRFRWALTQVCGHWHRCVGTCKHQIRGHWRRCGHDHMHDQAWCIVLGHANTLHATMPYRCSYAALLISPQALAWAHANPLFPCLFSKSSTLLPCIT